MTLCKFAPALVAAFVGYAVTPATAADVATKPVYKAAPPAEAFNPWMIRLRGLGVVTRNSGHVDQVAGSGLTTTDSIVPELDITYFFTRNIAAELILGVTKHHVTGTGAAATTGGEGQGGRHTGDRKSESSHCVHSFSSLRVTAIEPCDRTHPAPAGGFLQR